MSTFAKVRFLGQPGNPSMNIDGYLNLQFVEGIIPGEDRTTIYFETPFVQEKAVYIRTPQNVDGLIQLLRNARESAVPDFTF